MYVHVQTAMLKKISYFYNITASPNNMKRYLFGALGYNTTNDSKSTLSVRFWMWVWLRVGVQVFYPCNLASPAGRCSKYWRRWLIAAILRIVRVGPITVHNDARILLVQVAVTGCMDVNGAGHRLAFIGECRKWDELPRNGPRCHPVW